MSNNQRELTVKVYTKDFLFDDSTEKWASGEIAYSRTSEQSYTYNRADYTPDLEGWGEWINDLANVFKSEGVEFQGQSTATLPDGSYIIDYRDGLRREVSACFTSNPDVPELGEPDMQATLQEFVDQQAIIRLVG